MVSDSSTEPDVRRTARSGSRRLIRIFAVPLAALVLLAAGPQAAGARIAQARDGHLTGIDVSHWQGLINWSSVRGDGVRFAIAKATEAQGFVDSRYARNKERAEAQGVLFGAYHFARPDRTTNDAIREADHFVRTAKLQPRNLVPVLDLEVTGGLGRKALIRWTRTWLQRVESRLGVKPMIYTSPSFWQTYMGNSRWFADNGYPLWIAHWRVDRPRVPASNWGGRGWAIWQVTDCGKVAGISGCVDIDLFRGLDMSGLSIRRSR